MATPILDELLQRTTVLRALACELVGDAHADDVVQEAAIQSLTAPPKKAGPIGGWLFAVVRNVAGKHRRAEHTRHRHETAAARPDVAMGGRGAEDVDTLRCLTEVVTALPEPYRATILARYLRDQTPTEIAAATDTPVRTVKTRLQRGLALLRERLDERDGDWRVAFTAAFALDSAPTSGARPLTTTMKITVLATIVLLPVCIAFFFYPPDPAAGGGGESAVASSSNPSDASTTGASESTDEAASLATGDAKPAVGTLNPKSPSANTERPLVRLDVAGPAAFRRAFRPTNIGALLDSVPGRKMWSPWLGPIEKMWQQMDAGAGGEDFAATRQRVLEYTGRIRALWMVEPGSEGEPDQVFGVFALERDGATDLAKLAGDLSRAMRVMNPGELTKQRVGDREFRRVGGGQDTVTLPMVIDGSIVGFFGPASALDRTVPRCLAALAAEAETGTGDNAAPVSLHVDLAQLRGFIRKNEGKEMAVLLGIESLESLQATLRPVGPHAQLEVAVQFGKGNRGIWAGLLPAVNRLPEVLARVPKKATPWLAVPFRPADIFRAVVATMAVDRSEGGVEGARKRIRDDVGLDLDTELLDHLSGEVMVLGDLWEAEDVATYRRGEDPVLGACVAMSVKNEDLFRAGLDTLLDKFRGAVQRYETREVEGVKITRLGSVLYTGMHIAVGKGLFVLAFGKEGVAQLEALVLGKTGQPDHTMPIAVEGVRHLAPKGHNGVGLADLDALFSGQLALVLELIEDAMPPNVRPDLSVDDTQKMLDEVLPLIRKHELTRLVTMTGQHEGLFRLRVVW